ncbi:unnamed protein product [Ambrosiozyma monospora]|uniref:Unnamed protein product n=1 Tax=Ambrosiozyma monospora TaxID=43982 RepID=A0ACB5TAM6_AMBMO|nr:unnamed protein product [Ambrosiozyma monospora]
MVKKLSSFDLAAGESKSVSVEVPYKYAFSYFDCDANKWNAEAGEYGVLVGNSSVSDKFLKSTISLSKGLLWSGL